ncbi:type 2 lanthipeptide synthetase LanM family protein [Kamptonema formosum]|uniref:type 2 lanthipeptide synthetase LanM family protein n=1 Tax=Kamptonema formosum TaxID=331992 RepID=UPI000348681E|nr:type 2 lanthipeptide synthetase LanM family protein [Oscillatoria sp. PCC 10802]
MIDNLTIAEFACRASNLSERLASAQQLAEINALPACTEPLSSLDTWTVNKLAGKLAATQVKQQLYGQLASHIPAKKNLQQVLADFKLFERNLSKLPAPAVLELMQPNAAWLEVYRKALATLDLPPAAFADSWWYAPDIYYRRFAKVCEPFLRLLQQALQPVCDAINQATEDFSINRQVIANIQAHLLDRFEREIAGALETDIKVYCYQKKIANLSDAAAYVAYLEETFKDEGTYHRFYRKFPVLGRWLAQVTHFLIEMGGELLYRLTKDRAEISATFFGGEPIKQIKSFYLGQSDPHAGGRSVAFVELEFQQQIGTVVYKPRCIKSEAAMQGLLETLTGSGAVEFATYRVLCKDGYGYAEFLPVQNRTESREVVEKFYKQLGGYLAIFHILGGSDLHFENILVSNCNAFICDCETVLEVVPRRTDNLPDTLFDSVFRTGMLDWPLAKMADGGKRLSLSAYNGGESYETPFAVPQISNRMSLELEVERKVGVRVEVEATNRIYYNGELVRPQDYQHCIVEGFGKVYEWAEQNAAQAIKLVEELFADSSVRFVNRATQVYAHLLDAARHPKCLAEPLEVDLVFHTLIERPRLWDDTGKLAELELTSLWQLDIPIFTAKAGENSLIYNGRHPLPDTLAISPLSNAVRRIQQLSPDSRCRQEQYIHASFSAGEINSPHFIGSAVNYARQIGAQLCSLLQDPSQPAPWQTVEFTPAGKRLANINSSLYSGSAGICLFLAYLDAIYPQAEFRQAAERALAHAIEQRDGTMIGAFQGTAGSIYLLTHLAQLWEKPALLELAGELCDEILPRISQDTYFDIIHGAAGVIPVIIGLAQAASGKGLTCAELCAQHLLEGAIRQDGTLSWPYNPELARGNLTGFSHGASGIGWALIRLGCYTNSPEYIEAGRQAFAYEKTQFDEAERNWYDWRTSVMVKQDPGPKFSYFWCSGSAGIGLSRIDSWAALGKTDADLLREAQTALDTTLRNFHKLSDDSLCHGKSGNAELLLRFALLKDEPYLQMEANVQATQQWRNFERARRWTCGAGGSDLLPDLMTGLAGIGMHFLRLAYPERVPSPLLLDSPNW